MMCVCALADLQVHNVHQRTLDVLTLKEKKKNLEK